MIYARLLDGSQVEIDVSSAERIGVHPDLFAQVEEGGFDLATEIARWSETLVLHDVLGRAIPKRMIVLVWSDEVRR